MSSDLISAYLAELSSSLPRRGQRLLIEIAGGLEEAVEHYERTGLSRVDAERAAIAEFGSPAAIAAEYTPVAAAAQVHRYGLAFMASGPLIGGLWLIAAFLTGPVPDTVKVIATLALFMVVPAASCATFSVIATTRRMPTRMRSIVTTLSVTACSAVILDSTLIAVFVWLSTVASVAMIPALIAAAASATRLVLAARGAVALQGTRAALA